MIEQDRMSNRKSKDYNNGKIYMVVNDLDDLIYVGHTTTTLSKRMYMHKSAAKIHPERRVYKHVNLIGFDHFRIELIEPWPCQNEDELVAREGFWIRAMDTYKNGLNSNMAGRSRKEYFIDNRTEILAKQATHKPEKAQYDKARNAAQKALELMLFRLAITSSMA